MKHYDELQIHGVSSVLLKSDEQCGLKNISSRIEDIGVNLYLLKNHAIQLKTVWIYACVQEIIIVIIIILIFSLNQSELKQSKLICLNQFDFFYN